MSMTARTGALGCALLALSLTFPDLSARAKGVEPAESRALPPLRVIDGNPLKVHVGSDLSFQIYNSAVVGPLRGQIYPSATRDPANPDLADMGWMVRSGTTLYAPRFGDRGTATGGLGTIVPFGGGTQDPISGTGSAADPFTVVTRATAGTLELREVVIYENDKSFFEKELTIRNPGATSASVTVYLGSDIFLASSDSGKPTRVAIPGGTNATGTGGRTCPNITPTYNILHIPLTPAQHYTANGYSTVWQQIGAGTPLPNTVSNDDCIDNGAALQWNLTIPAGGSRTLEVLTSFGEIPTLSVDAYAPPLMTNEFQYVTPHGSHGTTGAMAANVDGDPQLELVATAGKNSINNANLNSNSLVVMDQDVNGRWYPNRRLFVDNGARLHLARPTRALPFPPVVAMDSLYNIRRYGGNPLQEIERFTITPRPTFAAPNAALAFTITDVRLADVEPFTPGPELLFCGIGPTGTGTTPLALIQAYNLVTRTRVLSIQTTDCRALEVAQLDTDPALEIIAAGRQTRIFDSTTQLSQWLYQLELPYTMVAVGNLDNNPGNDFVLASPGLPTRLFTGNVPQIFGEIPFTSFAVSGIAVIDIDGNSRDELILGTGGADKLQIYDTSNLAAPLREVDNAGLAASHIVVANFDDDAAPEAWWTSDILTATRDQLVLADLATGAIQARQEDAIGPIHVASPAQLDSDPGLEVAVVSTTGNAGFSGARVFIYGADTGLLKRTFSLLRDPVSNQGLTVTALALAQLDGVGPMEIVVSGVGFANFAMGLDSMGNTRWYVEQTPDTPIGYALPRGMIVVDSDENGIDDVFLHTDAPGGLFELNGANGAIRWRAQATSELPSGLALAQLDTDRQPELVVAYSATPATIPITRIYDVANKSLERVVEAGGDLAGVLVSEPRGSQELLFLDAGDFASVLRLHDLATGESREWTPPFRVNLVDPRPFTDGRFFLAGNGRLYLMDWNVRACVNVNGDQVCEDPQFTQRSSFLDLEIGLGSEILGSSFLNPNQERRVFVGGQGAVWQIRFPNILFSDGFEAPTPIP